MSSTKVSSRTVLAALDGFAEGAERSAEVVKGCEEFLCTPLCPGWLKERLVAPFKLLNHEQGLNKLPRFHGAWLEHIRRAHVQAVDELLGSSRYGLFVLIFRLAVRYTEYLDNIFKNIA